jgi:hypothetical protein
MTLQSQPRGLWRQILRPEPPPSWRAGRAMAFVAGYFALWLACLSVVSISTGEINRLVPSSRNLILSGLAANGILILGLRGFMRNAYGPRWQTLMQLATGFRQNTYLAILLFALGLAWALDLLGVILRLHGGQVILPLLAALPRADLLGWGLAILWLLVLQPIAETLIFSGLLYPVVANRVDDNRLAIALTAFVFMLVSVLLSPAQNTWHSLIQPFFMGAVVLCFRAYYQSTRAAIVARSAFGLFFVLAALLAGGQ